MSIFGQSGFRPAGGAAARGGDPMFDDAQGQGGTPHLMQHLWDAYVAHLGELIEERKASGAPAVTIAEATKRAPATGFAKFASKYLAENRARRTFFIDDNIGLELDNHVHLAVAPGVSVRGTMQDAGAIGVTEGHGRNDLNGVVETEYLKIG